ncbi:WD40 repeat domain-containing protein [Micromonospora cathayae]|uniref:WD40 repeat domain-containing protein n=1 Tax=Micromonospora cathayae TaxID=3028804 RepID=A0ABY7ZYU3_9ACTN|nr:WD40 repeat domain-containing protein [Micromonospora sp. HUAS 3]WDZ87267.1 WD40 repeat domain-containing protein [Micromonospora sp. HUAS 3]
MTTTEETIAGTEEAVAAADLAQLLEMNLDEAERYLLIGKSQHLVRAVRQAVENGAVGALEQACTGQTRRHRALPALSENRVRPDVLGPPYRPVSQSTVAHALRALAALGLALTVEQDHDPTPRAYLAMTEQWLAASRLCLPSEGSEGEADPDEVSALLRALGVPADSRIGMLTDGGTLRDPVRSTAWIWLLDLSGRLPGRTKGPSCGVVFDQGERGGRATLTLSVVPGLPPVLAPDPATMTLCAVDDAFQQMLVSVRRMSGKLPGAVLWSVAKDGRQLTGITGPSIGGAFSVLHHDLTHHRPVLSRLGFSERRPDTVIVGAVDHHKPDLLCSVGGYPSKLKAMRQRDRLIVPESDYEEVVELDRISGAHPTILGAATLAEAARLSRRPQRRKVQLVALLLVGVLAIVAGGVGLRQWLVQRATAANLEDARLSNAAKALQDRAAAVAAGDPALALRLAAAGVSLAPQSATRGNLVGLLASTRYRGGLPPGEPQGPTTDVQLSSDGRVMLTTTGQREAVLWTGDGAQRWTERGRLKLATWDLPSLSPNGRLVATADEDALLLFNVSDPDRPRRIARIPTDAAGPVAFSRDGRLLLTATVPPLAWNVADPAHPKRAGASGGEVSGGTRIAVCGDDASVAVAGAGEVILYRLADDGGTRRVGRLPGDYAEPVTSLACTAAGRLVTGTSGQIGVGDVDGTVAAWDVSSPDRPRSEAVLPGTKGAIDDVAVSPDGRFVAATGGHGTAVAALPGAFAERPVFGPVTVLAGAGGISFDHDGARLLSSGTGGPAVEFWDVADLTGIAGAHDGAYFSHRYSAAGDLLAAPSYDMDDGIVALFRVRPDGKPQPLSRITTAYGDPGGSSRVVALAPDRGTLAAVTPGGIGMWKITDPADPRPAGGLDTDAALVDLVFTRDSSVLVGVDTDGEASVWDLAAPVWPPPTSIRRKLSTVPGAPTDDHGARRKWGAVAVSVSAPLMATASSDYGTVALWRTDDPRRPEPAATIRLPEPPPDWEKPLVVALSADGTVLAAHRGAGTGLRLWDVTDPDAPVAAGTLTGYASTVNVATFAPRGRLLATADGDSQLRLWDVNDPAHPVPLLTTSAGMQGHPPHLSAAFAGTGTTVYFGGEQIYSWPVAEAVGMSADPLAYACQVVGRGPDQAEWDSVAPGQPWREVCR